MKWIELTDAQGGKVFIVVDKIVDVRMNNDHTYIMTVGDGHLYVKESYEKVKSLLVDDKDRVKGFWQYNFRDNLYYCSECRTGFREPGVECPACGALMEVK